MKHHIPCVQCKDVDATGTVWSEKDPYGLSLCESCIQKYEHDRDDEVSNSADQDFWEKAYLAEIANSGYVDQAVRTADMALERRNERWPKE